MRVLLVDDDGDSRTIFRTIFEFSGYEILECGDGVEALRLAGEHLPDAVVMDLQIPGRNGWETTRALQQDPKTRRIPVIVLSAHALPEHKARAREAGCVGYLTKPIEPRRVVEEVEQILRARQAE